MSGEQASHVIVDSGTVGTITSATLSTASVAALRAGAAHLASSQATPGTSSGTIAITRPTRRQCTIVNIGSVTVYVGETTATTAMGALPPGTFVTLTAPALLAGITASGTASVSVFDEYD